MTRLGATLLLCACAAVVASVSEAVLVSSSGDGEEDLLAREEALLRYNGEVNIGEEISIVFCRRRRRESNSRKKIIPSPKEGKEGVLLFYRSRLIRRFLKEVERGREGEELN